MDLRSGVTVWLQGGGPFPANQDLGESLRCDVAVVGAGITGALVAWELVRAGLDVVILDRREVGRGSTAASTALIQYEIDTPLLELRQAIGRDRADRAYLASAAAVRRLGEIVAQTASGCDYEELPSLYLASTAADASALEREAVARQSLGLRLDFLPAAAVAARFPFRRDGALFSENAGQLNPFRLTHDLVAAAAAGGARVRTGPGAAVQAIDQLPPLALRAAGGTVLARHVVLATGYESQAYLHRPVASLQSTYVIATAAGQPFDGWDRRCLIWETARPYLYLRSTADGRVLVGGEDEATPDPERRDAMIAVKASTLADQGRKLFATVDFAPALAWAGTFAETPDGLPFIGCVPRMPAVWFALGYGGNGITFSVLAAEIIREACLGRTHEAAELFSFER